jgi:hypothetical protein
MWVSWGNHAKYISGHLNSTQLFSNLKTLLQKSMGRGNKHGIEVDYFTQDLMTTNKMYFNYAMLLIQ